MALWGGRFSGDTGKNVQKFTQSISYDKRLYKQDIAGSKAHAAMLGSANIIPRDTANAIIQELDNILKNIENNDSNTPTPSKIFTCTSKPQSLKNSGRRAQEYTPQEAETTR